MLGSRALGTPDEARYSEIPREMVVTHNYVTPRLNGVKYFEKPAFFYWLQSAAIKMFGLGEWSLRFWTALFALAGGISVYLAGNYLFNARTGLISAVILATSLLYYGMSRVVTLDMTLSVLMSGSLFAFLAATHLTPGRNRRLLFWLFYVLAALATLTKGLIGIVVPGLIIGSWIALTNQWRLLKEIYLPSGLTLLLLIAVPWHVLVIKANPEFFHFYFIHEHFERFLTKVHQRYQPPWFFIPIVLLGLFPWTVFLFQAIKFNLPHLRKLHEQQDALFLLLWVGLIFVFFSVSDSKLIPYILPIFPPLALLLGRYLSARWEQGTRGLTASYWGLLATSLIFAIAFVAIGYYRPSPNPAQLRVHMAALAIILVLGAMSALWLNWRRNPRAAFVSLMVSTMLFLMSLNASLPLLDTRSVKDLALALKPQLKTRDDVVTYETYYQDLPFYLQRRVTIADWKGELEFGTTVEDDRAWMIDKDTFWRRWQSPATIYMMTSRKTYEQLRNTGKPDLHLIAENAENVVLRNKSD